MKGIVVKCSGITENEISNVYNANIFTFALTSFDVASIMVNMPKTNTVDSRRHHAFYHVAQLQINKSDLNYYEILQLYTQDYSTAITKILSFLPLIELRPLMVFGGCP